MKILDLARFATCLISLAALAEAAAPEVASLPAGPQDVLITLQPEKTEFEIGEPILVEITFHNQAKAEYIVEQDYSGDFMLHAVFVAKDSQGRALANPYARSEVGSFDVLVSPRPLHPGGTVTFSRTLNESVRFTKAGDYTIEAAMSVYMAREAGQQRATFTARSAPLTVHVKDFDQARRQTNIDALIAAASAGKIDYARLPFDEKHVKFTGGKPDIVRILAFFDEPRLTPFFLDFMEEDDINGYAHNGLFGLSDRAAVLKAIEERLDHPESHFVPNLLYFYGELRVPMDVNDRSANWHKQREALIAPYREKAIALLKSDKEFRYARLASRLCHRDANDAIIVDYVLHAKPIVVDMRWCATSLGETTLPKEDEALVAAWLNCEESSVRDNAMRQLLRLNRAKYLPVLRQDMAASKHQFSDEVLKLADAP